MLIIDCVLLHHHVGGKCGRRYTKGLSHDIIVNERLFGILPPDKSMQVSLISGSRTALYILLTLVVMATL